MRLPNTSALLLLALLGATTCSYAAQLQQHHPHHAEHNNKHEHEHKQQPGQDTAESYWQLAGRVVPSAVLTALHSLVQLNASVGPDDVKPLRIALLHAREALDAFSFAFPADFVASGDDEEVVLGAIAGSKKRPALEHSLDMWEALRKDLDAGYEVLGNFQDLAHSLVEYNQSDVKERLDLCLQWLDTIVVNRIRYGYDAYIARTADHFCKHRHISKLFWDYKQTAPLAELSGMENILHMVRESQVAQIVDNYTTVMAFQHVYTEPDHSRFHLFRKLVRSVLAVLEFFPQMLPTPTKPTPHGHEDHHHHHHHQEHHHQHRHQHRVGAGSLAALEEGAFGVHGGGGGGRSASGSMKAPLVSASDQEDPQGYDDDEGYDEEEQAGDDDGAEEEEEQADVVTSSSSSSSSSARRLMKDKKKQSSKGSDGKSSKKEDKYGGSDKDKERKGKNGCDPQAALADLQSLFKNLGQVNNKVFAYEFYTEKGMNSEASKARDDCDAAWNDMRKWMAQVRLMDVVQCFSNSLVAAK